MKKIKLIALLLLVSIFCFGQSEHLKFRNIEIKGEVNRFVDQLKEIGYTVTVESDEATILNGVFIGKECRIYVLKSEKTKTVWGVGVYLPEFSSWNSLLAEYKTVKEQLIKRYGKITENTETFISPFFEGDGLELTAIDNGKCIYVSYWELRIGTIMLKISNRSLLISYYDKMNTEKAESEKIDKVYDDL